MGLLCHTLRGVIWVFDLVFFSQEVLKKLFFGREGGGGGGGEEGDTERANELFSYQPVSSMLSWKKYVHRSLLLFALFLFFLLKLFE